MQLYLRGRLRRNSSFVAISWVWNRAVVLKLYLRGRLGRNSSFAAMSREWERAVVLQIYLRAGKGKKKQFRSYVLGVEQGSSFTAIS